MTIFGRHNQHRTRCEDEGERSRALERLKSGTCMYREHTGGGKMINSVLESLNYGPPSGI